MLLGNSYNESFYHIIQLWKCSLTKHKGLNNNNKKIKSMHSFLHYVNSKELGSKETNQTRDNMIIYAYLIYTYIYFYLSGGLYEVFFKSEIHPTANTASSSSLFTHHICLALRLQWFWQTVTQALLISDSH